MSKLITSDIFDQWNMNKDNNDCRISHSSLDDCAELDAKKVVLPE